MVIVYRLILTFLFGRTGTCFIKNCPKINLKFEVKIDWAKIILILRLIEALVQILPLIINCYAIIIFYPRGLIMGLLTKHLIILNGNTFVFDFFTNFFYEALLRNESYIYHYAFLSTRWVQIIRGVTMVTRFVFLDG